MSLVTIFFLCVLAAQILLCMHGLAGRHIGTQRRHLREVEQQAVADIAAARQRAVERLAKFERK